jgi:hypothetical protein
MSRLSYGSNNLGFPIVDLPKLVVSALSGGYPDQHDESESPDNGSNKCTIIPGGAVPLLLDARPMDNPNMLNATTIQAPSQMNRSPRNLRRSLFISITSIKLEFLDRKDPAMTSP